MLSWVIGMGDSTGVRTPEESSLRAARSKGEAYGTSPTLLTTFALFFLACGGSPSNPADAGLIDGSLLDGSPLDGNPEDTTPQDAGIPDAPDSPTDAAPTDASFRDASPSDAPDAPRLGAPYPIVLCHGFFGFEDFAGLDFATYFFRVREDLAMRDMETGTETLVFTPAVDPFNDSITRGESLLAQVESILAETGHAKVNLIGHSQGGLDARYVAATRPDLIASVTTIATPHRGTPLIDLVLRATEDTSLRPFIDDLVRLFGAPLYDAAGEETSLFAAMRQLSESGAADFNERFEDAEGVTYYSIAGRSGDALALRACAAGEDTPRFISDWTLTTDPIDPLFALSEALFDGTIFEPEPNDGLVRVSSAKWGRFLGCLPADHMDQVGHLLGDEPGFFNRWHYLDFYADLIAWLYEQGH